MTKRDFLWAMVVLAAVLGLTLPLWAMVEQLALIAKALLVLASLWVEMYNMTTSTGFL